MYVFIVPMLAGLVGLATMALPGLSRHGGGHAHAGHVGHVGHAGHGLHLGKGTAHAAAGHVGPLKTGAQARVPVHAGHTAVQHGAASTSHTVLEILDPRLLFSLMALFGASGQIAVSLGLGTGWSALLAVPAAVGLEWAIVGRLWRLAMRFEGQPSSPLETLLYEEVEAVTAFHNGKGMVRAIKDGRSVQLMARLDEMQTGDDVRTGDRLRVLEVDPEKERVTVTRI
jgi:hypothetical protein